MSLLDARRVWTTPLGQIEGWKKEEYTGLNGQRRICIVDNVGRVHHFNRADVS